MALGLGIDVIEVSRIEAVISRHGAAFLSHVFRESEQLAPGTARGAAVYYAGRWAAKEAVVKALGTGIGADCAWRDIEVLRMPSGAPAVELHGRGSGTARGLGIELIHLSISHEKNLACATAVGEGVRS